MKAGGIGRQGQVCGSVLTAAALAAGLVASPVQVRTSAVPRIESDRVQLQTFAASAVLGDASPDTTQVSPRDVVPAASAGAPGDPLAAGLATALEAIGRAAIDMAGLVLAPLWYLAFPITYQMASSYLDSIDSSYYSFPDLTGLVGLMRLGRVLGIWLEFPLRASSYLLPTSNAAAQPSPAATMPEAGRGVNPAVRPEVRAAEAVGAQDQTQDTDRIPPERPRTHHPRRDGDPASHRSARTASEPAAASAATSQDGVSGDARASLPASGDLGPVSRRPSPASSAPIAGARSPDHGPAPAPGSRRASGSARSAL